MKIGILGFSSRGTVLCKRLRDFFLSCGDDCTGHMLEKYATKALESGGFRTVEHVQEWTGEQFQDNDAIIFIGAAGIAVRMVAPYVKSKTSDPAVVVVDELGLYAISLLSGHLGGANELAERIAAHLGAIPVITTATDINHRFAVDIYAKKYGMRITDMRLAKEISADILEGIPVGFMSDLEAYSQCPQGTVPGNHCHHNIRVTVTPDAEEHTLYLVPAVHILGIGCRKGSSFQVIEHQVTAALEQAGISRYSICAVATIDIKAEEAGLLEFADWLGIPLYTYTSEELNCIPGTFTKSDFVNRVTGTDNVCERAAMAACGNNGGCLVLRKSSGNGVTVAVARRIGKAEG